MAVEFSVYGSVCITFDSELVECVELDAVCAGYGVDWGLDDEGLSGW